MKTGYNNDSFLLNLIFTSLLLFYNIKLLMFFFVYTYYITFYIILIDIFVLFRYIYLNNTGLKEYSLKIMILISIILILIPLPGIYFFYNIYTEWFHKIIAFLLGLISFFILIFCYYSKIFSIIIIIIISIIILFFFLYNESSKMTNLIKKYKFIISLIISLISYYLNNI